MKEILVGSNEEGQRLDKLAIKFLPLAGKGFIYKMIRKKNITLNDKKCEGNEILKNGDSLKFYLADDTITKFQKDVLKSVNLCQSADNTGRFPQSGKNDESNSHIYKTPEIIYEDADIVIFNKPAGLLSQKATPQDVSMNEILIAYLIESGCITIEDMKTFRPSICNRLDRNTSGLIICGKSLHGLKQMAQLLKTREAHKDYIAFVNGEVREGQRLKGHLKKDSAANRVQLQEDGDSIETDFKPLYTDGKKTILMVRLITGKTHQIRAHLASIGHPLIGDSKYGDGKGARRQLLHAYRLTLPDGRIFTAPLPEDMKWELGKPEAFEDLPWKI